MTEPITYYNLSVTSANIAQGVAAGNGEFPTGSIVEIAAVPIEGYRFMQWQDGNMQNPRSVTLTGNASYVASFEVSTTDISKPFDDDIIITTERDMITVNGAAGERIRLFDSLGRMLANEMNPAEVKSFRVPASGAYLVQVGNRPARKVVIIR